MSQLPDGRAIIGIPNQDKNPRPTETVGAPGFTIYSGWLQTREKDSRLNGTQRYITYSDILANTTIVAAGVRYFVNLVAKATWTVQPADESTEAEAMAEKIEDIMHNMTTPWSRVVRRTSMGRFYGFSIQEWTMKTDEETGELVYMDIEPRPQRTIEQWDTDESGTVNGVVQRSPQTQEYIYIPRGKTIYFVDDTLDDSPEGLGLIRHIVSTASKLQRLELLESWGYERDLRGTPVVRGPLAELAKMVTSGQITQAQADALVNPLETWAKNALKGKETALFIDSATYRGTGENQTVSNTYQWDAELLTGDGGPHAEVAQAIERLNREIARVLGVEQLLLGGDGRGSLALSRDKTQSFGLMVDSTLRELTQLYERDFLDPLFELNGWDKALKPTFKTSQAQYRDIEQITQALVDLAKAGAPLSPDDPAVNEVRDLIGLSDAPEEDLDIALPATGPTEEEVDEEDVPGVEDDSDKMQKVLPTPVSGEQRSVFVSRFMANQEAKREFPDKDQRLAVAMTSWRRSKK